MAFPSASTLFGKPATPRIVRCYHCRATISVPGAARTASCPVCYKGLILDDLRVRDGQAAGRLSTCGRVVVERRGRAVTRAVEAAAGVEVHGTLEAKVVTGGPVHLSKGAHLKGECHATSLVVEAGGVIEGAFVRIGPDAFEPQEPSLRVAAERRPLVAPKQPAAPGPTGAALRVKPIESLDALRVAARGPATRANSGRGIGH